MEPDAVPLLPDVIRTSLLQKGPPFTTLGPRSQLNWSQFMNLNEIFQFIKLLLVPIVIL